MSVFSQMFLTCEQEQEQQQQQQHRGLAWTLGLGALGWHFSSLHSYSWPNNSIATRK
jgi:hypothetical protein